MLGWDKWKIGTKLENSQFPKAFKGEFYCLSLNGKNTPHFTILTSNAPFDSRIEPETPKRYVFEQFFKHSLNFEPLPPLISGLNSKFDYAILCVLNWSLVSQNFVLKSYLYQKLLRKTLGGLARPPPPLRSGRVKNFIITCTKWETCIC